MSEVKWIKITVDMFEDEKIKLIESMPEGTSILLIWIKLLTLAGKCNDDGYIYLKENFPYTDEMLSTIFNMQVQTVRLAIQTFEQFGMIEVTSNNYIRICNWEKHQNVKGLEKIRNDTRERVRRHRESKKLQESACNVTDRYSNETEEEVEEEVEEEKEIPYEEIVNHLNEKANKKFKPRSRVTKQHINARWEEGFRVDDFKQVINNKVVDWKDDPKMDKFLRPQTLFNTKFEAYLNEGGKKNDRADWEDTSEKRFSI